MNACQFPQRCLVFVGLLLPISVSVSTLADVEFSRPVVTQSTTRKAGSVSSAPWHQDAADWFKEKRVPWLGAIKDVNERPLTRHRLAVAVTQVLMDHYEEDRALVERWRADPILDFNDVEPIRYRSTPALAAWFVERLRAALLRDPKELRRPTGGHSRPGQAVFKDLDGHPSSQVVDYLGYAGVLTGFPDGKFHGERRVTQMELATMFMRFNSEFERNCRKGVTKLPSAE